ncbi:transcriptional repressor LexA [Thermosediminibacter oceani]|uniref:LexA repressor n=1 Tax=Thermosediminibacter oceani (strain ATCC BAA-1034 / DSM 16646 / JW/IW-1228P) TaxID=555079 RepID=D9S3G2_THEOJ|nr:transcriptional repressor LexA [Thermosediminibacter oceani]ADL07939.1 SOS-response transcriptional repressor, LexA [Thermosediminibacter oceani DSM 16646]
MYESLTPRQKQILDYIYDFLNKRGYPPSVREICSATNLKSTATVHSYLVQLEKKGYISRDPQKPRAIVVMDKKTLGKDIVPVPLVGKVTAGQPMLAEENIQGVFSLPKEMVPDSEVFMLKVQGDSMIDAGIFDGDYVIVKVTSTAENGDIVVALLGDEATVKRFFKEKDHIRLQPENQYMEPIIVKDVKILGKVIGLFRKF